MIKPLFMWAGGKTKLIKHYLPYMPDTVDTYYEPFFGGGAMFLYVMQHYNPKKVIINDINQDIMRIYQAIQTDLTAFLEVVDDYQSAYIPLSKEKRKDLYFRIRHAHAYDYADWSNTYEAAVLYFLMKTGFNGIYQINKNTNGRFGTPSGLLNQKDTIYDKTNVKAWHTLLQDVDIYAVDWREIGYVDRPNTFIFYDPPYRGCFTSYGQAFTDEDQQQLLDYCRGYERSTVFLTNRDIGDTFYDNIAPLHKIKIPVTYTAGRRKITANGYEAKPATELLLYSRNITNET